MSEEPGCCTFPSGRMSIYAFITSISAYLFVLGSTAGCFYARMDGHFFEDAPYYNVRPRPSDEAILAGNLDLEEKDFDFGNSGIGLFSYEEFDDGDDYYCIAYSSAQIDNLLDGPFRTARVFGILANILVGSAMLFLLALSCINYSPAALYSISAMMIAGSFCQLLTLVMFNSKFTEPPYNASFYFGSGMALFGAVVALACGGVTALLPHMDKFFIETTGTKSTSSNDTEAEAYAPGTETVTETILPSGRKRITKTTVDMDGNKTVEQTIVNDV